MTPGRRFAGFQVWLVAALVAVGIGASLAILLVVLPTLESSIRGDRAKQEAASLLGTLETSVREAMVEGPGVSDDLAELASQIRARTGAEVRVEFRDEGFPGGRVRASTPEVQEILPHVAVTVTVPNPTGAASSAPGGTWWPTCPTSSRRRSRRSRGFWSCWRATSCLLYTSPSPRD